MKIVEQHQEILEDTLDKNITKSMIEELDKWNVFRGPDFDEKLLSLVGEIRDKGVEIGEFLASSRRIVFKGKYNTKSVVIKFSHALHNLDHDERQQQKEEMVWETARKEGDDCYFAEVFFSNMSSNYIIQEYCKDIVKVVEDGDLPIEHQRISKKYCIRELQIGKNDKNNTVFVDYGM